MEELNAELKLLHWHKLANEAALKAALIRTKSLRSADVKAPREKSSLQEKASWMAQVIEEEQRKPLQVSKEFVSVYSAKEAEENERLDSEVQRHIDVLKRLREKISVRDESRQRKHQYKELVRDLHEDKLRSATSHRGPPLLTAVAARPEGRQKTKSTLSTVINSLDKLVELERRITGLENDSLYDRVKDSEDNPQVAVVHSSDALRKSRGSSLQFTKKRTLASDRGPASTVFAVRMGKKAAAKTLPRPGASLNAVKRGLKGPAGPTFMTSLPEAPKARGPETDHRVVRQDAAISGWLQAKKSKKGNVIREFTELRSQMDKRKAELRKNLERSALPPISRAGQSGSTSSLSRMKLPSIPQKAVRKAW